jgi:hypothetical protein
MVSRKPTLIAILLKLIPPKGPLFHDPGERHNQGTPNGKKPRTQDITPEEWILFEHALQDYLDPRNREFFINFKSRPHPT